MHNITLLPYFRSMTSFCPTEMCSPAKTWIPGCLTSARCPYYMTFFAVCNGQLDVLSQSVLCWQTVTPYSQHSGWGLSNQATSVSRYGSASITCKIQRFLKLCFVAKRRNVLVPYLSKALPSSTPRLFATVMLHTRVRSVSIG